MKIGYARKSTHLQDVAHQVDELTKAGCEQIYQDQTSRSGPKGTVAKLAMRQPFVLFKGLTFQKLCL
ncbi:recombinase family protein, partial [Klebsiella pneumoniae]|uniref:recombinase family protein n=1 Tax=Klebsiella pneumoniae TaxID=573 RepID=UPI002DB7015C